MRICYRLFALPSFQVWASHLSGDWAWADQRNLCDEVIEFARVVSRKRGHLRPRLNLKHANGVGFRNHLEDIRAILRQMRQVYLLLIVVADQADGVFEYEACQNPM